MATCTSIASGNWSDTSTWDTGVVPVNGDTVIISVGHDVLFDVNQSSFANGLLLLTINGILTFKHDIVTCLKMNGNVIGNGELRVGTVENQIQRPAVSSEYRAYILLSGGATINVPTIRMYGWYPDREVTQLLEDAASAQNQIVLVNDLGLQQGDVIGLSCLNEWYVNDPLYTVASYNSETKTVTLTDPLETARTVGDYVLIANAPIKIGRTVGNGVLCGAVTHNVVMQGVQSDIPITKPTSANPVNYNSNWDISHSRFKYVEPFLYLKDSTLRNCSIIDSQFLIGHSLDNVIENCYAIDSKVSDCPNNAEISNCVDLNYWGISKAVLLKNHIARDCSPYEGLNNTIFKNSKLDLIATGNVENVGNNVKFVNCEINIKEPGVVFPIIKAYNTIFTGQDPENNVFNNLNIMNESFNHNQEMGNYKAWCNGGKIETERNGTTPIPGVLIFTCQSDSIPVFRDYPVYLPSKRTLYFRINVNKSFSGGIVKFQLIDPVSDPLIDPLAQPLSEKVILDVPNTNQTLLIGYRSRTPKGGILRILCQSDTGTVNVNAFRIEELGGRKW
ncbi:MAG: G8 domain-containing protein [Lutibacter sp.]|jgi:hypothetical protein